MLFALGALVSPVAAESNFTTKLDAYAKSVVASSKPGTFSYLKSKQTMATPLVSHLATFSTNDATFHSNPKASTDRGAYMDNTARRMVWEAKFCSTQLKDLMRNGKINIVIGEIVNREGETQFMATCTRD